MRVIGASAFCWCLVPISQTTMTSLGPLPWKAVVWFSWAESPHPLLSALGAHAPKGWGQFLQEAGHGQARRVWTRARADANLAVIMPLPWAVGCSGLVSVWEVSRKEVSQAFCVGTGLLRGAWSLATKGQCQDLPPGAQVRPPL